MSQLSEEFVDGCRVEKGFRLRGESMTRIEVFVDAAFAFAVTMLVISIDEIPGNVEELFAASKLIPAFIASVVHLMWIWHIHSTWSQRFGLEDGQTTMISVMLITQILIFIYPLKILYMGFFAWLTDGFLPSSFDMEGWDDLRYMFLYFALAFVSINLLLSWMHKHALNLKDELLLSAYEIHATKTNLYVSFGLVGVGVIAAVAPFVMKDGWVPFAGFAYALIGVVYHQVGTRQHRLWQSQKDA